MGAARRSVSIRSRIAASAASWRGVCRSRSSSGRSAPPSRTGKRSARDARTSDPSASIARRDVLRVERRLPLLAAAELVAADRAAVVLARRAAGPAIAVLVLRVGGPGDLVEDDRAIAGRAAAREAVGDRRLEAGLAARGRGEALDGGVEVAQVGRPEDDLGEQPVERRRLEADGLALGVDGGAGDPAAAAEQVEDDLARLRCGLEAGRDQRRGRRRREPLERGEAEPRFSSQEQRTTRHMRPIVADSAAPARPGPGPARRARDRCAEDA